LKILKEQEDYPLQDENKYKRSDRVFLFLLLPLLKFTTEKKENNNY
jgi:hypothetical protein